MFIICYILEKKYSKIDILKKKKDYIKNKNIFNYKKLK